MRVAIIPARGGSQRIPKKNIREFHGRPILAYSIEAARHSQLFDRIVVSSDDPKTRTIARQCGADAVDRDMKYCFDEAGTQAVVADALVEIGLLGWEAEEVCCVYATTPMMFASDIARGYYALCATRKYAYVHGWYYWGKADWFDDVPLTDGAELERPEGRWIDINTEEDWKRAEKMYAALHKEAA